MGFLDQNKSTKLGGNSYGTGSSSGRSRIRNTGGSSSSSSTRRRDDDEEDGITVRAPETKTQRQKNSEKVSSEQSSSSLPGSQKDNSAIYKRMRNYHAMYSKSYPESYKKLMQQSYDELGSVYSGNTSNAVATLQQCGDILSQYGIDVTKKDFVNDDFFQKTADLDQYLIYNDKNANNTPSKPSAKRGTKLQWAAWARHEALKDEKDTKTAEAQLAMLKEDIGYWAGRKDLNLTPDEILAKLDWNDYKMLVDMQDKAAIGEPKSLNRVVDYYPDWVYGYIWSAQNGHSTGDAFSDTYNYYNSQSSYVFDQDIHDKMDPTSGKYSPYSVASTMEKECLYFGVDHFDADWITEHEAYKTSPDATLRTMYANVAEAEKKTQAYEEELATLMENIDGDLMLSGDVDSILEYLEEYLEDSPGLARLDQSMYTGKLVDTTRPIPYSKGDMIAYIREQCELRAAAASPENQESRFGSFFPSREPRDVNGKTISEANETLRQSGRWLNNQEAPTEEEPERIRESDSQWHEREDGTYEFTNDGFDTYGNAARSLSKDVNPNMYGPDGKKIKTSTDAINELREKLNARTGPLIRSYGTDAEKGVWLYGGTRKDHVANNMRAMVESGMIDSDTAGDVLIHSANAYAGTYYFDAHKTIKDHEALLAQRDDIQKQRDEYVRQQEDAVQDREDRRSKARDQLAAVEAEQEKMKQKYQGNPLAGPAPSRPTLGAIQNPFAPPEPDMELIAQQYGDDVSKWPDEDRAQWEMLSNAKRALQAQIDQIDREDADYRIMTGQVDQSDEGAPRQSPLASQDEINQIESAQVELIQKYGGTDPSTWSEEDQVLWQTLSDQMNAAGSKAEEENLRIMTGQVDQSDEGVKGPLAAFDEQLKQLDEEIAKNQDVYDRALDQEKQVRYQYDIPQTTLGLDNQEQADFILDQLSTIYDIATFATPDFTTTDLFNLAETQPDLFADDSGNAPDHKQISAYAGKVKEDALEQIKTIKSYIEWCDEIGLDVPKWVRGGMEAAVKQLQGDVKDCDYYLLQDNKDFESTVAAARSRLQEQGAAILDPFAGQDISNVAAAVVNPLRRGPDQVNKDGYYRMDYMSEKELDTILYLDATQGEAAAQAYYAHLAPRLESREGQEYGDRVNQWLQDAAGTTMEGYAEEHPIAASLLSSLASPAQMLGGLYVIKQRALGTMDEMIHGYNYHRVNPNSAAFVPAELIGDIRNTSKESLMKDFAGDNAFMQFLVDKGYDAAISALDSGMNATLGFSIFGGGSEMLSSFFGAMPMGIAAGGNTYRDVLMRTGSEQQADAMGILTMLAETGTEAVEFSGMMEALKADSVIDFMQNRSIGKILQLDDAVGEGLNELIEGLGEQYILGRQSDFNQRRLALMESGMSAEQADYQAGQEFLDTILESAVMGALSSNLSEGAAFLTRNGWRSIDLKQREWYYRSQGLSKTDSRNRAMLETSMQDAANQYADQQQGQQQEEQQVEAQVQEQAQEQAQAAPNGQQYEQPIGPEQPQQERITPPTRKQIREGVQYQEAKKQAEVAGGELGYEESGEQVPVYGDEIDVDRGGAQSDMPDFDPMYNGGGSDTVAPAPSMSVITVEMMPLQNAIVGLSDVIGNPNGETVATTLSGILSAGMSNITKAEAAQIRAAATFFVPSVQGDGTNIRDIYVGAQKAGVNLKTVNDALVYAGIGNGETRSVYESILQTGGEVTKDQIQALLDARQVDGNNESVQKYVQERTREQMVAERVNTSATDGALNGITAYRKRLTLAKSLNTRAKNAAAKATQQAQEASASLTSAQQQYDADPTNGDAANTLQAAIADVKKKTLAMQQAEVKARETESALKEAQQAYDDAANEELAKQRDAAAVQVDQEIQESAIQKEEQAKQDARDSAVKGSPGTTFADATTPVQFHYEVLDVNGLIASNDTNLNPNEQYPAELQPRDRTRQASRSQVLDMAQKLNPEWLGASANVQEGAPIVGPDYVVESGNGRVLALETALERNLPSAQNYRSWLVAHAQDFGVDPSKIPPNGMLVRVRDTDVDRQAFVKTANEQTTASYSAAENAKSDADKLTQSGMNLFVPNDNGKLNTKENSSFLSWYAQNVIPKNELGKYIQSDGSLSIEGLQRVRNALFQKAYDDVALTKKLSESTDDTMKNVMNALTNVAPLVAMVKDNIATGNFYDVDVSKDIAQAANAMLRIKQMGLSVEEYLSQVKFPVPGVEVETPTAELFMRMFDSYKRSGKWMTRALFDIMQAVESYGNPDQLSLFETTVPNKFDVVRENLERTEQIRLNEKESGVSGQTSMFSAEDATNLAQRTANQIIERYGITDEGQRQSLYDRVLSEYQTEMRRQSREYEDSQLQAIRVKNEKLIKDIGGKFGINIEVIDTAQRNLEETGKRFTSEGEYNPDTNTIYIDRTMSQTEALGRVLFHELTHSIEGAKQYKQIADTIINALYGTSYELAQQNDAGGLLTDNDKNLLADIDAKIGAYSEVAQLTPEQALQEIVADATKKVLFGDEQYIQSLVKTNPSLGQRILNFIKDVIDKLRGTIKVDNLDRARELFEHALTEHEKNIAERTQHSLSDEDTSYLAAIQNAQQSGDYSQVQSMVDRAASDAGYNTKVYHGTPYGGFTEFKGWNYFTEDKKYADRYQNPSASSIRGRYNTPTNQQTYELYLNPGRVFDTRVPEIANIYNKARIEYGISERVDSGLPDWTAGRDIIDYIEENDLPFDTVILDEGADGGYGDEVVKRGISYVTRSNNVKSADAVVYDNNGSPIPLSQRFNKLNSDIRYSLPEDTSLDEENLTPKAEDLNPLSWDEIISGTTPNNTAIDEVIKAAVARDVSRLRRQREAPLRDSSAAVQRIQDRINLTEPKAKIDFSVKGLETALFDYTRPVFEMTRAQMKANGTTEYDSSKDVRDLLLARDNMTHNLTEFNITKYMVDREGNRIMKPGTDGEYFGSLSDITKHVQFTDELDFNTYWLALHMKDRAMANKAVFDDITLNEVDEAISELGAAHPDWQGVVSDLNEWYNQFMQTWLVDSGCVQQNTLDLFHRMYPHYAPSFREMGNSVVQLSSQEQWNDMVQARKLKKITGSQGNIKNPVVQLATLVQRHIQNVKQIEVMRAFDEFFSTDAGASMGICEKIPDVEYDNSTKHIPGAQDSTTQQWPVGNLEAGSSFQYVIRENGEDVLQVPMPDGTIHKWRCSDSGILAAVVHSGTPKQLPLFFRAASKLTNILCSLSTGRNFNFALQNFASDGATALITGNAHGNVITYNMQRLATAYGLIKNRIAESRGQEVDDWYDKYQKFAEMGSAYLTRDNKNQFDVRSELYSHKSGSKFAELRQKWIEVGSWQTFKDLAGQIFGPIEFISELLENTTRATEFLYGHHDLESYAGLLKAGKAAREVTVDFSKSGTLEDLQMYGKLVPFARAQMQGVYKTLRMFSEENAGQRGKIARRLVFNTLVSSLVMSALRGLSWDDDEKEAYEEMNAYEKMKYAHVKLPGLGIVRIKRSQDGIIGMANAVGELIGDLTNGYEDDDFAQLAENTQQIAGNMIFNTDTVFDPFIDANHNQTWYGSRIEPAQYDGMAEQDKWDDTTLAPFKALAQVGNAMGIKYSPMDWQYIFQQYTGSAGKIIIGSGQAITSDGLFGVVSTFKDEILGRFTYDPVYSSYASSEFYEGLSLLDGIKTTAGFGRRSSYLNSGLSDNEYKSAIKKAEKLTGSGGSLARIKKKLKKLWAQHSALEESGLPKDQIETQQRAIRMQINLLALEGNSIISDYTQTYGKKSILKNIAERFFNHR